MWWGLLCPQLVVRTHSVTVRRGEGAGAGEEWATGPLQGRVPETVPMVEEAFLFCELTSPTRSQGSSEGEVVWGTPTGPPSNVQACFQHGARH